jgi:predicted phage-related endonuclease
MVVCDITYQHPLYDFITFTPDALESSGFEWPRSNHIVELKQTSVRDQYGSPGTDEVSAETGLQCQLYMGCCGAKTCDVAVHFLRPRHEFAIYHLKFNQDIFDNIIETAREFWHENVLKKVPPPLDASEGTKRLLAHLYPRDVGDLFAATKEIDDDAGCLHAAMKRRDEAEKDIALFQNRLKDLIGHHAGVFTSLGKITWKRSKDREDVDYKGAFERMVRLYETEPAEVDAIIVQHTTTRPGSRRFVTNWNKSEEEA